MGSSICVPDVNPVGVRVADGEVALECERDDHEDGRGHEDLARRGRTSPSKTLSLNTIPISVLIHNECPTYVRNYVQVLRHVGQNG